MEQFCFGVDIGGTNIKTGLFTTEGKLMEKWEFSTRGGKELVPQVAEFVLSKIEELKLDKKNVVGIGIGIPGPVKDDGVVLEAVNLGLGRFNLEEELSSLTGLKVKAGNDANVAALGEYWQGSGKEFHNQVMVTLGTGVGGGIIQNGSIIAGSNGAAGEIGHLFVNKEEKKSCNCGKRGCLEQYASATGIVRLAKELLEKNSAASKMRDVEELSAKLVFDFAKEGDELALEVVESACQYLAIALANVAQTVDPEAFIIGGGVSKAGNIIIDTTKKYYVDYVMKSLKDREFRLATLGNDAGIYGSAKLLLS